MSALLDTAPPDRDDQAAMWCLSLAEGELPRHERDAFDLWLGDPENATAFDDAARVWNAAEGAADRPELIHMRRAALESYQRANQRRWATRISAKWYWGSGIAAVFVLALLSTVLLREPLHVYQTGIGERRIAMLDDGSKLSLDADTEVDVRLRKDRRELVLVHGRAKFDVAKDPLRPFTVTAGDRMVVATGTSFSVEMLEHRVHVLLYEGHVAVLDRRDDKPVPQEVAVRARNVAADQALTPGKELVATLDGSAPATVTQADMARSLSWESGQLSFDDEPLPSAVARMNRYSAEKLAVGDQAAAKIRVNGVFTAGDTDAFVEGVSALNGVRAERGAAQITLRSN
ncbi:MAG: anti-FecI sigma factor FecR [Bradyrhizobium sp.]|nr:anti-FecI sigma factor FecR [Bradyrhizobium sp.]